MTLLRNRKYFAFTYIEVSVLMCAMILIIQGIVFTQASLLKNDHQSTLREKLFYTSHYITQSLMVYKLNQDYQVFFRCENVSPFQADPTTLSTLPMKLSAFLDVFHASSPGNTFEDDTKIVCFQKKRTETDHPSYQYVLYVYQDKDTGLVYGYSSFCQNE